MGDRHIHLFRSRHFPYLCLDDLWQFFIVKFHVPFSVDMGNSLIVTVYLLQAVPHSQTIPLTAIAKAVPGPYIFFLRLNLFQTGIRIFQVCACLPCIFRARSRKIKGKLPICSLFHLPLLLFGKGAGGSFQFPGRFFFLFGSVLFLFRLFLCRLPFLPLCPQGFLRERCKQGIFASLVCAHIFDGLLHNAVAAAFIRRYGGKGFHHILVQRRAVFWLIQHGLKIPLSRVHIPLSRITGVRGIGAVIIKGVDTPGKLYLFILGGIRHFFRIQVSPGINQFPNPFLYLVPVHLYGVIPVKAGSLIGTGEFYPFGIMPFVISHSPMSAVSVFVFQEIRPLLCVMPLHEIRINPHFPLGNAASTRKHPVNLIFGDKAPFCRLKAFQSVELPRLNVKFRKPA
ncbi:hypothetical protein IMSAGC019_02928 [Lachnospiraceae bacterium]|nr:hypothetical protein IMSAGC019_02928 [Lachnospiraceae bacterium]